MYNETTREMTAEERKSLQEQLTSDPVVGRWTIQWASVWSAGFIIIVLLAIGLVMLKLNPILGGIVGGFLFVGGIICLYAVYAITSGYFRWRNHFGKFQNDIVPQIKRALADGRVHVKQVTASAVIEIEQSEDEGSGYIFDIGQGKSLLLKGHRYSLPDDTMPWPASVFEIVRSADNQLWIGIFSTSQSLTPIRVVSTEVCSDDFLKSEKEEIVEANPEAVLNGILKNA
jgi:hypothetical protein